jgi:uncharacterized OB-fold protein
MSTQCPKCGADSASPPAEVYCIECATEGWEQDAAAWREVRMNEQCSAHVDAHRSPDDTL